MAFFAARGIRHVIVVPEAAAEGPFEIPVICPEHAAEIPQVDVGGSSRIMMLRPADFPAHGYTAGCLGCICLQTGRGSARRHTEECRARIEAELVKTPEGRLWKDRETLRRDVEFDKLIAEEDVRQQRDQAQQQPARSSTDPAPVPAPVANPEDDVAGIFSDFDDDDDDDDDVAHILSQGDDDGKDDALGGNDGSDEPSSKRHRSGSLSATRVTRAVEGVMSLLPWKQGPDRPTQTLKTCACWR